MRAEVSPGIASTVEIDSQPRSALTAPIRQLFAQQMVPNVRRVPEDRFEAASESIDVQRKEVTFMQVSRWQPKAAIEKAGWSRWIDLNP